MTILGLIFKNKNADDSNFTDIALGKFYFTCIISVILMEVKIEFGNCKPASTIYSIKYLSKFKISKRLPPVIDSSSWRACILTTSSFVDNL